MFAPVVTGGPRASTKMDAIDALNDRNFGYNQNGAIGNNGPNQPPPGTPSHAAGGGGGGGGLQNAPVPPSPMHGTAGPSTPGPAFSSPPTRAVPLPPTSPLAIGSPAFGSSNLEDKNEVKNSNSGDGGDGDDDAPTFRPTIVSPADKKGDEEPDSSDDDAPNAGGAGGAGGVAGGAAAVKKSDIIEFRAPNGMVMYYNARTGKAQLKTTDANPALRNQAVVVETWNGTKGDDEPQSVKIERSLNLIERTIDHVLAESKKANLSQTIADELRGVKDRIESIGQSMDKRDNRSDVSALLEIEKLNWNFDARENKQISIYRSTAIKTNHREHQYREWHCPQYLSDFPLPPHEKTIFCVVRLPEGANPAMAHTRLPITPQDTVSKAIRLLWGKCKNAVNIGVETDYVLKAQGLKEYLEGESLFFNYAYVRQCIRDGKEIELSMVKRPQPPPPAPIVVHSPGGKNGDNKSDDTKQNQLTQEQKQEMAENEYAAKVDRSLAILGPGDYLGGKTMNSPGAHWSEFKHIPMSELHVPFRVKLVGLDNCVAATFPRMRTKTFQAEQFQCEMFLFHGMERIKDSVTFTTKTEPTQNPRWMQWIGGNYSQDMLISSLPRATRFCIMVYGLSGGEGAKSKKLLLGWAVRNLVDESGRLVSGAVDMRLWTVMPKSKGGHGKVRDMTDDPEFMYRAPPVENKMKRGEFARVRLYFEEFVLPIVAPICEEHKDPNPMSVGIEIPVKTLSASEKKMYDAVLAADSLEKLNPEQKKLLWQMRHSLIKFPAALPKFLQCVDWCRKDCMHEAHRLLSLWAPPLQSITCLELLDARYADYKVREYAITNLSRVKDHELSLFLLQLVQCLKYESYHASGLSRFLIERSLANPNEIGHHVFWHLKAEMHVPFVSERFALLLEEYVSFGGVHGMLLRKQQVAVNKMQKVAEMVVRMKRNDQYTDADVKKAFKLEIEKLNRDCFGIAGSTFQIPFNPKLEASSLIVEKCRYMSSKMVPLWLVFKNVDADAPPIYILFKSGDDLRQDILTLQMLRVMDKIWLNAGLDMRLKPYNVIATGVNDHGEGVGMLEVVTSSDTTSNIQVEFGGGAMGALRLNPIDDYLHHHNKDSKLYDRAVENFVRSCAGYCVATYVLGIGDRHNGNIMVTKSGHLFHIDFGHFLGNFKSKFGINRERAAFVFTPEMAYVMGGKKYTSSNLFKKFMALSTDAFKVLRLNANILENLFVLVRVLSYCHGAWCHACTVTHFIYCCCGAVLW